MRLGSRCERLAGEVVACLLACLLASLMDGGDARFSLYIFVRCNNNTGAEGAGL